MATFPKFRGDVAVSGELAFLRFKVSAADEGEYDERLLSFLRETRRDLEAQIVQATTEALGAEFEVVRLGIRKGSIEILVVIGTAYVSISQYKDFVESIRLLVSQLSNLIRRFLERIQVPGITVFGTWTPTPDLLRAHVESPAYQGGPLAAVVIWYLILSHAALLAVLLWMTIRWVMSK